MCEAGSLDRLQVRLVVGCSVVGVVSSGQFCNLVVDAGSDSLQDLSSQSPKHESVGEHCELQCHEKANIFTSLLPCYVHTSSARVKPAFDGLVGAKVVLFNLIDMHNVNLLCVSSASVSLPGVPTVGDGSSMLLTIINDSGALVSGVAIINPTIMLATV